MCEVYRVRVCLDNRRCAVAYAQSLDRERVWDVKVIGNRVEMTLGGSPDMVAVAFETDVQDGVIKTFSTECVPLGKS